MIQSLPKPPKIKQDEARLAFARALPCLIYSHAGRLGSGHPCESKWYQVDLSPGASEAHHVRKGAHAGTGRKPPASRTIPLCAVAHREYHELGHDTFCEKYGLDLEAHLQRINAEFARIHKPKPAREPRKKAPGLKSIRVNCECGQSHEVPASKLSRYGAAIRYRCIRTNQVMAVSV